MRKKNAMARRFTGLVLLATVELAAAGALFAVSVPPAAAQWGFPFFGDRQPRRQTSPNGWPWQQEPRREAPVDYSRAPPAHKREAPATTLHDHLALLDVAIEHEIDLAADISFYGASDFPMITRLLRALARTVPGFEFNSLRRSLPSPGQFEQLMDDGIEVGGPIGFGRR